MARLVLCLLFVATASAADTPRLVFRNKVGTCEMEYDGNELGTSCRLGASFGDASLRQEVIKLREDLDALTARVQIMEDHGTLGTDPTPFPTSSPTAFPTEAPTQPTAAPTNLPTNPPSEGLSAPRCRRGHTRAYSPSKKIAFCDNPSSCEQDKAHDCPSGFHLCTHREYNVYNRGWNYQIPSKQVVGAIYCRGNSGSKHNGAGHFTISAGTNAGSTAKCNAWYGSSLSHCSTSYGCNEKDSWAACCLDNPDCGDGVHDSTLEDCDDGNKSNGDKCDKHCNHGWHVDAC